MMCHLTDSRSQEEGGRDKEKKEKGREKESKNQETQRNKALGEK